MSSLLFVVIPAAVAVGFALIIGIILFAGRRRPEQPGWVPTPTGGSGTWNAEVLGDGALGALGGTMASTFGTFRLEAGVLSFIPDQAVVPMWQVPCRELGVVRRGALSLDGADVRLTGPMGDLRCNVSVERINRVSRNDIKDMRERRYAEEFAGLLVAHGARPLA